MRRTRRIKNKNKQSRNKSRSRSQSRLGSIPAKELTLAGSLVGASSITQGSELEENQSQSQNQSESQSFMFGGSRSQSKCSNDIADHILCFLELLNTIKVYHWSTLSYPTHKATDELYIKLTELVDSFIEIYIGHCSRGRGNGSGSAASGVPVFQFKNNRRRGGGGGGGGPGHRSSSSMPFCYCKSLDAFCKILDDNIVHLEGLTKQLDGYTDLVNIRDEMVGALAQALYLLRLK